MANCIQRLRDIAKGNYSDEEIKDILQDIESQLEEREGVAAASEDEIRSAISKTTQGLEDRVDLEGARVNLEELQVARNANLIEPFLRLKKEPLKKFVRALTIGTKVGVKGSRARTLATHSIVKSMGERINLKNTIDEIEGAMETLKSGQYDDDILNAINGNKVENELAQKLGDKIRELNDKRLEELALHGISVNKLEDRGIKQIHDPELLLKTADSFYERRKIMFANATNPDKAETYKTIAFNKWFRSIDSLLDNERTFGGDLANNLGERIKVQRKIYDEITNEASSPGSSTIQKRYNNSRFYHFKDASSQLEYSKQFGVGGLYDSLMGESSSFGNSIATLELAGNNPLKTIRKTVEFIGKQNPDRFSKSDIKAAIAEGDYTMRQAIGSSSRVYGGSGQLVRSIKFALAAKIAPTLLPLVTINDIAPAINEISRLGGQNAVTSTVKFFNIARKLIGNNDDLNEFIKSMEYRRDVQIGSAEKFTGVKDKELRNKMLRFMMKLSPHEFMNHAESISAAHELTLQLGQQRNIKFNDLPTFIRKTIDLYGIDENKWNLLRQGSVEIGGRHHITSDALRNIDRVKIADSLRARGVKRVSEARIDRELDNTQQLFTSMVGDRMSVASNAVGAQQRAFWDIRFDKATKKGRVFSNLWSLAGMLRMYETGILQRTLSPIIYGESGETIGQSILSGNLDWKGLGRWASISTTLGIIGFTMRDLFGGRKPNPKEILMRSALSPLGIIGQGLEISNRPGQTAIEAMLGPGFTIPGKALGDIFNIFRGDNPGRNAKNFVTGVIPPFNNSISRHAMNHIFQDKYGKMNRG